MAVTIQEVIFREKSSWQKEDCLFCDKKATLEAAIGVGSISSMIRCCKKDACKHMAAENAVTCMNIFLQHRL